MKTIQKIAAILYSVWAVYWGCVYTYTTIHNIKTIESDGIYSTIKATYLPFLELFCLFTAVIALSLFASSAFLIYNSFCKFCSSKRLIFSIIWLIVNIACIITIHKIEYISFNFTTRLYLIMTNRDIPFILTRIMSKFVLIGFSVINIILITFRIWRKSN